MADLQGTHSQSVLPRYKSAPYVFAFELWPFLAVLVALAACTMYLLETEASGPVAVLSEEANSPRDEELDCP